MTNANELTSAPSRLEWGVAQCALDGLESGDLHLVIPGTPQSLLCVMDGLGHGPDARRAADECANILRAHRGAPLLDLVQHAHEGLRATRGVAMTLALVDESTGQLEWVAIGNVEGVVLRGGLPRGKMHDAVIQRGGVVGYRLPPLKVSQVELRAGDVIVLASDGIKSGFSEGLDITPSVQQIADDIFSRFGKKSDDALVMVARYRFRGAP